MAKMFVHYNGTVEDFKKLSNISEYANKIVFIKGGANGKGAAIYTHGEYYANAKDIADLKFISSVKAGGVTATAQGHNGVIEFSSDDDTTVSVVADSTGIKIGLAADFVKQVDDNTSGLAQEILDREAGDAALLGNTGDASTVESIRGTRKYAEEKATAAKEAAVAAAAEDATSKANAAKSGAEATAAADATSKANTAEANAKAYAKEYADGLAGNYDEAGAADDALAAAKEYVDGKVDGKFDTVGSAAAAETAAKAYADGLAKNYDAAGSASTAEGNAKAYTDAEIKKLDATVGSTSVESGKHVAVQITEVDGKLTGVVINENDIASAATLAAVKADVDYFLGDALNKENAEAVKDTLRELQAYIESDASNAATMVENIGKAQDAADKAQGEVDALELLVAGKVDQSAYDTKVAELAKADADNLAAAKKFASDEIAKLDVADAAVAGQYVSAVSEADGKISVTRADLPTYTLVTGDNNGEVKFNGTAVKVKGLASAAYTEASAYATAAQGANADSALAKANANADAIAAMDLAEVSGYITKVSQADGKISATAVANIPAADITVADAAGKLEGANVEAVLAELADMWLWEEL